MAIELNAKGQPHVKCPNCTRLHLIRRNRGYTGKPINRYQCTHCGTTWKATEEEKTAILDIYKDHHTKLRDNKKPPKDPKPDKKTGGILSGIFGLD